MNMNDRDQDAERAWAYVHGEMADDARLQFEREMRDNPALRAAVASVLSTALA